MLCIKYSVQLLSQNKTNHTTNNNNPHILHNNTSKWGLL